MARVVVHTGAGEETRNGCWFLEEYELDLHPGAQTHILGEVVVADPISDTQWTEDVLRQGIGALVTPGALTFLVGAGDNQGTGRLECCCSCLRRHQG